MNVCLAMKKQKKIKWEEEPEISGSSCLRQQ